MPNRRFAERLNRELDNIGVPQSHSERVEVFAKLLHIPRFKAQSLLSGVMNPDTQLLHDLAQELEVNAEWLIGKSDDKAH